MSQPSTEEKRHVVPLLKVAVKYRFIIWYVSWKCPNDTSVSGSWGFGCSLVWAPNMIARASYPPTRCQIARIRRPCFGATTEGRGVVGRISVRIREVSGSNLGAFTDYSDHVFRGGPPFFQTCRNATLNDTTADSSQILASLHLLIYMIFIVWRCGSLAYVLDQRRPARFSEHVRSVIIWILFIFPFFVVQASDSFVQRTKINRHPTGWCCCCCYTRCLEGECLTYLNVMNFD